MQNEDPKRKSNFYVEYILMKLSVLISFLMVVSTIACDQPVKQEQSNQGTESNQKPLTITIPEYRDSVSKRPVAEHQEEVDNPLNDWYFSVKLYETPKTFQYLIKLKYEEIQGEDTLKLPNFGTLPKPVLQKGKEKYSCIIGFMDKENKFREYKKVHVKENHLKITALRHYAVATYEK
jgi:hypothetical protein